MTRWVLDYERARGSDPKMPRLRLLWRGAVGADPKMGPAIVYAALGDALHEASRLASWGIPVRVCEINPDGYVTAVMLLQQGAPDDGTRET